MHKQLISVIKGGRKAQHVDLRSHVWASLKAERKKRAETDIATIKYLLDFDSPLKKE